MDKTFLPHMIQLSFSIQVNRYHIFFVRLLSYLIQLLIYFNTQIMLKVHLIYFPCILGAVSLVADFYFDVIQNSAICSKWREHCVTDWSFDFVYQSIVQQTLWYYYYTVGHPPLFNMRWNTSYSALESLASVLHISNSISFFFYFGKWLSLSTSLR